MDTDYQNRMQLPEDDRQAGARKGGRKKASARKPAVPVIVVEPAARVPSQGCPSCGRAIHPRVATWRPNAEGQRQAYCSCPMCGARFVYTPPTQRLI